MSTVVSSHDGHTTMAETGREMEIFFTYLQGFLGEIKEGRLKPKSAYYEKLLSDMTDTFVGTFDNFAASITPEGVKQVQDQKETLRRELQETKGRLYAIAKSCDASFKQVEELRKELENARSGTGNEQTQDVEIRSDTGNEQNQDVEIWKERYRRMKERNVSLQKMMHNLPGAEDPRKAGLDEKIIAEFNKLEYDIFSIVYQFYNRSGPPQDTGDYDDAIYAALREQVIGTWTKEDAINRIALLQMGFARILNDNLFGNGTFAMEDYIDDGLIGFENLLTASSFITSEQHQEWRTKTVEASYAMLFQETNTASGDPIARSPENTSLGPLIGDVAKRIEDFLEFARIDTSDEDVLLEKIKDLCLRACHVSLLSRSHPKRRFVWESMDSAKGLQPFDAEMMAKGGAWKTGEASLVDIVAFEIFPMVIVEYEEDGEKKRTVFRQGKVVVYEPVVQPQVHVQIEEPASRERKESGSLRRSKGYRRPRTFNFD